MFRRLAKRIGLIKSNVPNIVTNIVKKANRTWPRPVKFLAGGADGKVYETTDPNVLVKIVAGNNPQEYHALEKLQNAKFGNQRIVPKFTKGQGKVVNLTFPERLKVNNTLFNAYRHRGKVTVFLMGRVGNSESTTLSKYLKTFKNKANTGYIKIALPRIMETLAYRGIGHGNLHKGNIMVSFNSEGKIKGMWIIDFGRSHAFSAKNTHSSYLARKFRPVNLMTLNPREPTRVGYLNREGLVSAPNAKTLQWYHGGLKLNEENIAKLRRQVEAVGKNKPRTSPRRAKSLSLQRGSPTTTRSFPRLN